MVRINDALTSRSKDSNGYLIVKDNPIAKAGVFDYLECEVNSQSSSDRIVKVCRTFENLAKNKDLFKGKPIKLTHKWVGKDGDSETADGAIYGEVRAEEPYLRADLIIYNPLLIEKIESGEIIELSPGYEASTTEKNGTYNGEQFAYIQDLQSVNHLAVVEVGRSGSDLRIQDSKGARMGRQKSKFLDSLKQLVKKYQDEQVEVELKEEIKEKTEDEDMVEILKDIVEVANREASEFSNEEDRLKAIYDLVKKMSEAKEEVELEVKEKEEVEDTDKTEDNELDKEEIVEVIEEVIEKVMDSKLAKFKDALNVENKRIQDSYLEVSKALGTNFDYSGKNVSDIYKFGYEMLSRQKLMDGMDAKTAFNIALSSRGVKSIMQVQDSAIETSKVSELLKKY